MTTADRHTDTDPRHGGSYRASDVDVTAEDDAARYDTTEDGTGREAGGYAQRHDGEPTLDQHTEGHSVDGTADSSVDQDARTERLDAQDTDSHGVTDPDVTDPVTDDGTRTEGGYPHSAGSLDGSDPAVDGHAAGRHADTETGARTVDVGGSDTGTSTDTTSAVGTGTGSDKLERLVPAGRVDEYQTRWDSVKGEFVDEPRQAVAKADQLVGELLDELDQLFRKQRSDLEHGLDADETSTEDLRLALRRYRSFFDRLLAL